MKATNWRTFYGYRPSRNLNGPHMSSPPQIDAAYCNWLREDSGGDEARANERLACQHELATRPLVVAQFSREPEMIEAAPKAKATAVDKVIATIMKLPWPALEQVQVAIIARVNQRLAA